MRYVAVLIALLFLIPTAHAAQPQAQAGVDLSKMPVEDAIQMMFMQVSEDARKDMKDLMKDMEKDRQKKKALRDAEKKLKDEMKRARDELRRRRIEERLARLKAEREAAERRQQARLERLRQRAEQERRRAEAREARQRKMEEERRRRHEARAERARARQQQEKGPATSVTPVTGIAVKKPCPNPNIDCHRIGTLKSSAPAPQPGTAHAPITAPSTPPKIKHDTVKNSIGNVR